MKQLVFLLGDEEERGVLSGKIWQALNSDINNVRSDEISSEYYRKKYGMEDKKAVVKSCRNELKRLMWNTRHIVILNVEISSIRDIEPYIRIAEDMTSEVYTYTMGGDMGFPILKTIEDVQNLK